MGLVAAFEHVGQPYRLCRVAMLAEMKNDAYARLNGRQETPVLITGEGQVLTETMAIGAWLEARDMRRRISFDPRSPQRDRMHQLMAFVNTGFTAAFTPLWAAFEMEGAEPETLAVLRDFGRRAVKQRHDHLEAMIGDTAFLVGDRLTLADTTLIGVARWAEFHQAVDGSDYPRLAALRRRIEAEPALQYALAIEEGERPAGSGACLGQVSLAEVIERFAA